MNDKKQMKSKIIFICAFLALFIMFLKKSNYIQKIEEVLDLRNLFEQNYLNYLCDYAGDYLTKQYKGGYDAKIYKTETLSKGQNALINFMRNQKYEYIKDYYSRIAFLFVIIGLDIIFIFSWISYCCCSCCNCCCFKSASESSSLNTCRFVFFMISTIFNLFVIIFSITLLIFVATFIRKMNGIACSTLTLVDHFRDGLGNSYPIITINRWTGIPGLIQILEEDKTKFNNVVNDTDLNQKIKYAISNYSNIKNDTCGIKKVVTSEDDLRNANNSMSQLVDSFNIDYNKKINNLKNQYQDLTKTENDVCKGIYEAFHDYINKYLKKIFSIFFTIILIVGFLGLLFLILYYFLKFGVFRIIYVIIWNISMLLMIIILFLSIILGLFGYIVHDGKAIIQYIFSINNLNSEDPLFIKSDSDFANLINTCVNGDGEFLRVIQEDEEIKNKVNDLNQNIDKYNNTRDRLKGLNCANEELEAKNSIMYVYISLIEKNQLLLDISDSLTNINCSFARNDEMIILDEINDSAIFIIGIFTMCFLLGICLGISILTGIFFVHRYKYKDKNKHKDKDKDNISTLENKPNDISNTNVGLPINTLSSNNIM